MRTLAETIYNRHAEFDAAMKAFAERRRILGGRVIPHCGLSVFLLYNIASGAADNGMYPCRLMNAQMMGGHPKVVANCRQIEQHYRLDGLDDAEWGVTLFARDPFQIKKIVYQLRFDQVSAEYADFGELFVGIQLPLDELCRRRQL